MTFKEKLRLEHPDRFSILGNPMGCPEDYRYEPEQKFEDHCEGFSCSDCWNREMPGWFEKQLCKDKEVAKNVMDTLALSAMANGNLNVSASCIKDSGARREFETGAVRDIQEGKGRCDLLPLDVVADLTFSKKDQVLLEINHFKETGCETHLSMCLDEFVLKHSDWSAYDMILEVSKHFEEGAKKYGEYNWQKGIPVHCYIDSAVRHYLKFLRGDTDEPHDRAFVWNIMCCIWTCNHKPELNEYKKETEKEDE